MLRSNGYEGSNRTFMELKLKYTYDTKDDI